MPDGSTFTPAPAKEALYEAQKTIHPKAVSGRYRRLKWIALVVLLGIFFLAPWLRWDRGPDAASQAILFDLAQGRFFIFGLEIWPQEIYYLTGILIIAAVGLFLATALAGRVWCGFGCPHTVWTDLFVQVERLFEGDRAERIRMERAPWTGRKILRKAGKHAFWIGISLVSAFGFCAYFTDAPALASDIAHLDVSSNGLTFLGLFASGTYAMAGWMREQMCYYMCPWPRIQSAMLDEHSLIVTYQTERGDNRGPKRKSETWEQRVGRGFGDCIDCTQCVQVCPMGIDVRTGDQAHCINCGLCADACDTMMVQIGRPTGLIKFDTLARQAMIAAESARPAAVTPTAVTPTAMAGPAAQGCSSGGCAGGGCGSAATTGGCSTDYRVPLARARTMIYLGVMGAIGTLMLVVLTHRAHMDVAVQRDRAPLFVTLSDGSIRNGYTFKVANKTRETHSYDLAVDGIDGAQVNVVGEDEVDHDGNVEIAAAPDSVATYRVYVKAPRAALAGASTPLTFRLADTNGREKSSYASVFLGPN